ncbi:Transcriptional regulator, TetR-family [Xenorhabdus poinarii G6]|uniref:Transcriptional regulator, TetR-family n=1 Tax=Xenorhabdus poinarii G6 TaxID=1354304 RepID=A0A068R3F6_9GAMM|nr:TetR/AcrR family transcriptional regulator [Xenorhabdus poinarii]CDG21574.1 Transcriptional regulator, TetR-family [Xenorhabdus poinarii G6]
MSGRPKEYDDQKVIESAMNVFWNNGYEASSTQLLCQETGLGRGSLYHAFGNKQGLYEKALRHYQDIGIKCQKDILTSSGTAKERLMKLLQWGIETDINVDNPRGCLALHSVLERSQKDPAILSINRHYLQRLESLIKDVIRQGVAAGELSSKTKINASGKAFLASYYGLRIMGVTVADRGFLQLAAEGIVSKI